MFIKETGFIEIMCYTKYAGIDLDLKQYPHINCTDDEIKNMIHNAWNSNSKEYISIMKLAEKFNLYPAEIYFIFLSILPLWDSRFGEVFSLFGGIDGLPTEVLARDMWEKNHGERALVRYDLLYGFFLEEGPTLKPKREVSLFLSGTYYDEPKEKNLNEDEFISSNVYQVFERIKDIDEPFIFYGPKGLGKKNCFKLLSKYKGFNYKIINDLTTAERDLFFAVVESRAVAITNLDLIPIAKHYLPYLKFYTWIFETLPVGINACPVFFSPLDMMQQYDVWVETAKKYNIEKDIDFHVLANQYSLSPDEIKKSFYFAERRRKVNGENYINRKIIYDGIHDVLNHQFESRAQRIDCQYTWEDLVLPENQKNKIRECCSQITLKHVVMEKWELGKTNIFGGITVLFHGLPGTGKTMAAQVIASQLGMELYKAELSAVVSKYVGETEKNLKRIFEDAAKSQAILFFDEADSLFGKRTEVKDSHDKYSNMEAAFLLQEMERYKGVVILATNFVENIDEAFKRRMKFIIEFPFPSAYERCQIWKKAIPQQMPIDNDVDYDFLSERFELTGSGIKNAVYSAAFLAAAKSKNVGMEEFILAVKREYEKTGKIFSDNEAGVYSSYFKDVSDKRG